MSSRALAMAGVAIGVCVAVASGQVPPAAAQRVSVDFNVSGTSTIRSWTCSVKGVLAVTPGTGSSPPAPGFASGVQTATVTVPVKAFTCPSAEMTQHLLEAMKADQFSEIVYRLERYEITGGQAQATGTMIITGVTQPLSFPVTLKPSAQGVHVEGSTRLDMSKWGVDPPVVMLGMLKVGPQIRIEFKGLVTQ